MIKRSSLIVHFRSPKAVKHIEKVANVTYYHKKRRYAVCYCDADQVEDVIKKLKKIRLVKRIEESLFETDEYQLDLDVK